MQSAKKEFEDFLLDLDKPASSSHPPQSSSRPPQSGGKFSPDSSSPSYYPDDPLIEKNSLPYKKILNSIRKQSGFNIAIRESRPPDKTAEKEIDFSLLKQIHLMAFEYENGNASDLVSHLERYNKYKTENDLLQEYFRFFTSESFWDGKIKDWKYLITIESYLLQQKLIPDKPFFNATIPMTTGINKAAGLIILNMASKTSEISPANLMKIYVAVKKAITDCLENLELDE